MDRTFRRNVTKQTTNAITDKIENEHVFKKKVNQSHYRPRKGPQGSRMLRFPDFMTTEQDGGKVVSLTHRPHLSPGNTPGNYFC